MDAPLFFMYVQNIVQSWLLCSQSVSDARGTVTPCDGRCLSRLDVRGPDVVLLLSHVRVGTVHEQPGQCIAVKQGLQGHTSVSCHDAAYVFEIHCLIRVPTRARSPIRIATWD